MNFFGGTIAIDGFSMVFPNSGTMVNNGFGPFERPKKKIAIATIMTYVLANALDHRERG